MKKILVPTDFSDNSLKAALYAAEIALKSGAELFFVHGSELGYEPIYQPFILHEKYNELIKEDRLAALQLFSKNIWDIYPFLTIRTALLEGLIVEAIVEYCDHNMIDIVIMGTRGAGAIKEIMFGTTTANLIAKTHIPVLTVPREYELKEPDALLFATTNFENDTILLSKLIDIARLFSAPVFVIVFEESYNVEETGHDKQEHRLEEYLRFLHNTYPDVLFSGEILAGSSFEGAIERFNIKNDIDIIAMITYPKSLLEKILRKSTTKKMAIHSRVPILAIPYKQGNNSGL